MSFLVLTAGFSFGGHLSNWTIYDLKEQFSKLAPWNMHSWFFLIDMNKRRKGTRLLSGHLQSD